MISTEGNQEQIKIILPEGLKYGLSMDVDTPALMQFDNDRNSLKFRTKVRHMASQLPGMFFSKYRRVQFFASGMVSMNEFSLMLN